MLEYGGGGCTIGCWDGTADVPGGAGGALLWG